MRNVIKQPFFNLFAKKRKNRGAFWASLLGLGLSAVVFGITRGNRKMTTPSFQNIGKSFADKANINMMDNAAMTEFSEDLMESALNKNNNH
ncbi:MAG TPA: hypothetical protein VGI04_11000 [Neobacillus sp.]